MPKIRIRYLSDKIEKLRYIDGKSDWIDLRAAETVELKAGESRYIPLGVALALVTFIPALSTWVPEFVFSTLLA